MFSVKDDIIGFSSIGVCEPQTVISMYTHSCLNCHTLALACRCVFSVLRAFGYLVENSP